MLFGPAPSPQATRLRERYTELMDAMERDLDAAGRPDPAPELEQFADELLERYPDITSEEGEQSPWADGPLKGNIVGSLFYFSMTFSRAADALPFIVERAEAHKLACFDPQTEELLVRPSSASRGFWRRRR